MLGLNAGEFEGVANATWWTTELQGRMLDTCVQPHGGYDYLLEHPIARTLMDARASRIWASTIEIMKEIVDRSLELGLYRQPKGTRR